MVLARTDTWAHIYAAHAHMCMYPCMYRTAVKGQVEPEALDKKPGDMRPSPSSDPWADVSQAFFFQGSRCRHITKTCWGGALGLEAGFIVFSYTTFGGR